MSHFTVLVPANDHEHLKALLQPYHEYECTGTLDQYVLWVDDIHDENLNSYETETIEVVVCNGEPIGTKYDRKPEIQALWHREGLGLSSNDEFVLISPYELVEMPKKEYYADFDTYMRDWCGYTEKRNGRYGRLTNPNKKWDWWSIGGRWTGLLKLKEMTIESVLNSGNGKPGLMTEENEDLAKCDFTLARLVDWDGMIDDWKQGQWDWYNKRQTYLNEAKRKGYVPNIVKEKILELWNDDTERGKRARETFGNIDTATLYECADFLARENKDFWFDEWADISKMLMNKRNFEETLNNPHALTYAFIGLDGRWNQRGEMGWFGFSNEDKGTQDYDKIWWSFVKSIPEDMIVFLVDCHI